MPGPTGPTNQKEITVGVAKNTNFQVSPNPQGGWLGTLTCPAPGCNANATVTSQEKTGPYNGACTAGHMLSVPVAKAGPAPSR